MQCKAELERTPEEPLASPLVQQAQPQQTSCELKAQDVCPLLHAGPQEKDKVTAASPIDAAGSASAVLLRDMHCALLRAIEDKGLERDKPQPSQARLLSPDSAGPVPWTANVARLLLSAPATKAAVPAKVCHAVGKSSKECTWCLYFCCCAIDSAKRKKTAVT